MNCNKSCKCIFCRQMTNNPSTINSSRAAISYRRIQVLACVYNDSTSLDLASSNGRVNEHRPHGLHLSKHQIKLQGGTGHAGFLVECCNKLWFGHPRIFWTGGESLQRVEDGFK